MLLPAASSSLPFETTTSYLLNGMWGKDASGDTKAHLLGSQPNGKPPLPPLLPALLEMRARSPGSQWSQHFQLHVTTLQAWGGRLTTHSTLPPSPILLSPHLELCDKASAWNAAGPPVSHGGVNISPCSLAHPGKERHLAGLEKRPSHTFILTLNKCVILQKQR